MRRRFATLDVFTDTAFAGNPLAVVRDAEGLDRGAMQALAREFNLPETVFVLPPSDAKSAARIRIFTPAQELPFAGHPTVGAAVLLGRDESGAGTREIVLEEEIGKLHCRVTTLDARRGRAQFVLPKLPGPAGPAPDMDDAAAALGLSTGDIGFDSFRLSRWSAGLSFTFVPVRGLEAIARARPQPSQFETIFAADGAARVYVFCKETRGAGRDFHARMFAPGLGIPEDPATGSAAAAFGGPLAESLSDGEHRYIVEQGFEMGRPSLIEVTLTKANGALTRAEIGGAAIAISEGFLEA